MNSLSFTTMATPEWDGPTAIRAARRYGYQGVDLRVSDRKGELTLQSSPAEIQALLRVFDSEGIVSPSLLCYNQTIQPENPSLDAAITESILRHLTIAHLLHSHSIRIFTGHIPENPEGNAVIARIAEAIAKALNRDKTPVRVVIQNHAGHASVNQVLQILDVVNNPRLGLVFSPDHCVLQNEDPNPLWSKIKVCAHQVYMADLCKTLDNGSEKYNTILPGKGMVQLPETWKALGGNDFGGFVTFKWEKIWEPTLEDPEVALPFFIDFVKSWKK